MATEAMNLMKLCHTAVCSNREQVLLGSPFILEDINEPMMESSNCSFWIKRSNGDKIISTEEWILDGMQLP